MELREIDAKITELLAMKAEAERREAEKREQKDFDEALEIFPRLVDDLRRLDELGYLPARLADALTDSSGKVNPGLYIKRPRAPLTEEARQQRRNSERASATPESLELPHHNEGRSQAAASPTEEPTGRRGRGTRRRALG
jgi:hypothetical protein